MEVHFLPILWFSSVIYSVTSASYVCGVGTVGPLAHAVPRWFIWFHPNNSNSSSSSSDVEDDMTMITMKITPPPPPPPLPLPPLPHWDYHHHPTTTTTTTTANTITTTARHVFKLKCYIHFLSPSFNYIFNHLEWRECIWNCNSDLWLGYLKLQLKISQLQIERACDSICALESFH